MWHDSGTVPPGGATDNGRIDRPRGRTTTGDLIFPCLLPHVPRLISSALGGGCRGLRSRFGSRRAIKVNSMYITAPMIIFFQSVSRCSGPFWRGPWQRPSMAPWAICLKVTTNLIEAKCRVFFFVYLIQVLLFKYWLKPLGLRYVALGYYPH